MHFWKHHENLPQVALTKLLCNFHHHQQRNETVKFKFQNYQFGKKSDRLRNRYAHYVMYISCNLIFIIFYYCSPSKYALEYRISDTYLYLIFYFIYKIGAGCLEPEDSTKNQEKIKVLCTVYLDDFSASF